MDQPSRQIVNSALARILTPKRLFALLICMLGVMACFPLVHFGQTATRETQSAGDPAGKSEQMQFATDSQGMAYVRDGRLFVTTYPYGQAQVVDDCHTEAYCRFAHLRWSPAGTHLAYLKSTTTLGDGLYVLDGGHHIHPIPTMDLSLELGSPPAWSPDGESLAYLLYSLEPSDLLLPEETLPTTGAQIGSGIAQTQVWLIHAPFTQAGQKSGEFRVYRGCGGAGYTYSERLYGNEELATWPQANMSSRLSWLPTNMLLFTRLCIGAGIGQFDLANGRELAPLDPNNLLAFTADRTGKRLAAVTWDHQIALGTMDGTAFVNHPIPGVRQPVGTLPMPGRMSTGGVFWGATSGRLYFTTRLYTETLRLDADKVARHFALYQDRFSMSESVADIYQTSLYSVTGNDLSQARLVLQSDDYGYGSLSEAVNGDLLFVQIENERALFKALKAELPADEVALHLPKSTIMRLTAKGEELEVLIENAGQLALAPMHSSGREPFGVR